MLVVSPWLIMVDTTISLNQFLSLLYQCDPRLAAKGTESRAVARSSQLGASGAEHSPHRRRAVTTRSRGW